LIAAAQKKRKGKKITLFEFWPNTCFKKP